MRRGLAVVAALGLAAGLLGCSQIDAGRVTNKVYSEPYTTSTDYCTNGQIYPGMPRYDDKGNMVPGSYPCFFGWTDVQNHPARYRLDLEQGQLEGWAYVSESSYNKYDVGDFFDAAREE